MRLTFTDQDGVIKRVYYNSVKVGDAASNYVLNVTGYHVETDQEDFGDPLQGSNLKPFSTFDNDVDEVAGNLALELKGGGW